VIAAGIVRLLRLGRRAALLALLGLAACSAPYRPPEGPGVLKAGLPPVLLAPAAQGAWEEGSWRADDGRRLPLRAWAPPLKPRAVILALHGFNDYANAFDEPARFWAAESGIAVYAPDQRGFGGAPYRGLWPGRERLGADLVQLTRLLRARHPGLPLYWLGESMGGAVMLAALEEAAGADRPDGLVLSAAAVWGSATMPWYYRPVLLAMAQAFPGYTLTGRGLGIQASDNIPMLRRLGADPFVIKGTRIDTIRGLADLMDRAARTEPPEGLPLLLLYGAKDEVIPKKPVERYAERIGIGGIPGRRAALYGNGWHMLLRDLDRAIVWRDVAAWIADARAPLPSGAEITRLPLFPDSGKD